MFTGSLPDFCVLDLCWLVLWGAAFSLPRAPSCILSGSLLPRPLRKTGLFSQLLLVLGSPNKGSFQSSFKVFQGHLLFVIRSRKARLSSLVSFHQDWRVVYIKMLMIAFKGTKDNNKLSLPRSTASLAQQLPQVLGAQAQSRGGSGSPGSALVASLPPARPECPDSQAGGENAMTTGSWRVAEVSQKRVGKPRSSRSPVYHMHTEPESWERGAALVTFGLILRGFSSIPCVPHTPSDPRDFMEAFSLELNRFHGCSPQPPHHASLP